MRRLSWALEERDVELVVSPGIIEVAGPRLSIRPVAGLSLLHLERPSASGGKMLLKAIFDRKDDIVAVHKEALNFKLESQKASASPIPFHPGAVKYFAEKGIKVN